MRALGAVFGLVASALVLGAAPLTALADSSVSVGPVQAVFVPAEFATHYSVTASDISGGRTLTYKWELKPPAADPNCNHFSQQPDNTAIWHHGDQDGCNHNVQVPNVGHPGTVTVIVSDGVYQCEASYFGTESGPGSPALCSALGSTTSNPTPKSSGTQSGSTGISPWLWIIALVMLIVAGYLLRRELARRNPCRELGPMPRAAGGRRASSWQGGSRPNSRCGSQESLREREEGAREGGAEGQGCVGGRRLLDGRL